ncbi:hypothetical protein J3F84DRAFT_361388, partial [Trichoderma pleuroticola]
MVLLYPCYPQMRVLLLFFFQTHSRPWSAAVQGALPRCDAVRSDPSSSVYLQTGLIYLLASVLSPLNAACPCRCGSQAPMNLGLAITSGHKGTRGRNYSPVSLSILSLRWHLSLTCPPKGDCPCESSQTLQGLIDWLICLA